MPVLKNDVLSVPVWDSEMIKDHRVRVEWSQNWTNHTADYYVLMAKNRSQGKRGFMNLLYFIEKTLTRRHGCYFLHCRGML